VIFLYHSLLAAVGPVSSSRFRVLVPASALLASRACRRCCPAGSALPAHRQQWIRSERVVILQIFMAERQTEHARRHERRHGMLDPTQVGMIDEAGRELSDNPRGAFDLAQPERLAIGRQRAAIEAGDDLTPARRLKNHRSGSTLCPHNGRRLVRAEVVLNKHLMPHGAAVMQ
jgi:hypothetical protein